MPKYSFKLGKHQKSWEEDPDCQGWLSGCQQGTMSYCKLCRQELRPHLADLKKHALTKKHTVAISARSSQQSVASVFTKAPVHSKDEKKKKEIRLAIFVACHTSINAVDPLGEIICNEFCPELQLHHTKCRALIVKVIGPFFTKNLLSDLANSPFSLMVDEATDVSVCKFLGIAVRYFSKEMNKIVTTYLDLQEIVEADACGLYAALKHVLLQWGLQSGNFIGLSTDGASVMRGQHNSLQRLLHNDNPGLIYIRCSCHSFDLAAKEAMKVMPSHLEFMLRESYSWFSCSSKRMAKFKQLVEIMGVEATSEDGKHCLSILKI
jgi:hypothetical protein